MCGKDANIKIETYNITGITHGYHLSCNFGIRYNNYSTNDTSTLTGDYITELVIFKV